MPTFMPCCVDNVSNIGGTLCDWNTVCFPLQKAINTYCKNTKQTECAPVPQIQDGQTCYCCCSCYAYDTPIEASIGEFVAVQDIQANVDSILAGSFNAKTGTPEWIERVVDFAGGTGPGDDGKPLKFDFLYYCTYQVDDGSEPPQFIISTVDHLYLRPDGKVTPVQHLKPGDKLQGAHGKLYTARFIVPAAYTGGLYHMSFDKFNNKSLDGHLISSNGVVCADYSVQLAYSNGTLNPNLLDDQLNKGELLHAASAEYHAKHASRDAVDFVSDPQLWPNGLEPHLAEVTVNIPPQAKAYFTKAQAKDIMNNITPQSNDSTANIDTANWLFAIQGAFYPDIVFLIDWKNDTPNAFYWEQSRQRIVLITGGLMRIPKLSQDGLALILSHMMALSKGTKCVGPADYAGVFYNMREVWHTNLYGSVYSTGLTQVQMLFDAVDPKHATGNPKDICNWPSLDCRIASMNAAAAMMPMPDCANPDMHFGLFEANAGSRGHRVRLIFNRNLDEESAGSTDNYHLTDDAGNEIKVHSAQMAKTDNKIAILKVAQLLPAHVYIVKVTGLLSATHSLIDPDYNEAAFMVPASGTGASSK